MLLKRKTDRGFTLAEVLLAMVLLAMAAAGIALPFATAASVQRESGVRLTAARLASDKIEQLRAAAETLEEGIDLTEAAAGNIKKADGIFFKFRDRYYADFSRKVTVETAAVGDGAIKWVTVTVNWKGREVASLSTLLGQ